MTVTELSKELNTKYETKHAWPDIYQVDAVTYVNVVSHIILQKLRSYEFEDIGYEKNIELRSVAITVGPHAGVMFKGVELLMKTDEPITDT